MTRPASGRPARRPCTLRRLEDFVSGEQSRLAYAAARRLADGGAEHGSPLYIYGECGVGKTHLLQGIVQRFAARSGRRARYLTAEQFTNEYIGAVKGGGLDGFRRRTRRLDLLAVDDVHFLANKIATQSELLHTIDAIGMAGARLVIASDEHPLRLGFNQQLGSRFVAGMVARLERPDRATRIALIGKLAASRGLKLNDAAAEAIAARCVGSVRELEGAINKLAALRLVTDPGHHEVGVVLVEQLFRDGSWRPKTPVRLGTIVDVVCASMAVTRADLMGTGRPRRVVAARGLIAFLARELTTLSYPEIAHALGRKHHSTVHSAVGRVALQLEQRRRIETGESDERVPLCELVDRLRHEILRAARH